MAFSSSVLQHIKIDSAADIHPFFYLVIEGCPYIFASNNMSALPADFRPTGFSAATVKPLLKVGQGLDAIREEISRREGIARTTEITLALGPDTEDDFLLALFATKPASMAETRVTDTLDWTITTRIKVEDVTDFAASGYVWVGSECIYHATKDAINNWLTTLTRAQYGTVAGYFPVEDGLSVASLIVRDRMVTWEGRVCHLYMGLTSSEGNILDALQPMEIFAGPIASNPQADDGVTWSFRVRDLTALLETEIGGHEIVGKLPGPEQFVGLPGELLAISKGVWVQEGVNDLLTMSWLFVYKDDVSKLWTTAEDAYEIILTPGWYPNLAKAVANRLNTALSASAINGNPASLYFVASLMSQLSDTGFNPDEPEQWITTVSFTLTDDVGFIEFDAESGIETTIGINAEGSVFRSLGFEVGAEQYKACQWVNSGWKGTASGVTTYAAYQYPIPYAFNEFSTNLVALFSGAAYKQITQALPASGVIAVNKQECVTYSAILALELPWDNYVVFALDKHGAYGSDPVDYKLKWKYDSEAESAQVETGDESSGEWEVKILWGAEDESIFDLLLKLCISTGGNRYPAGDYAPYDVAGIDWLHSATLPGTYFDIESFDKYKDKFGDPAKRSLAFSQSVSLRELFDEQLKLLGLCLVPRPMSDGTYKLSLVESNNLLNQKLLQLTPTATGYSVSEGSYANSLDLMGVKPGARITKRADLAAILNRATVAPLYSVAKEEQLSWRWEFNELDSQLEYRVKNAIHFDLRGAGTNPAVGAQIAWSLIAPLVIKWARRTPIFEFLTDRKGWAISPGDKVVVSDPVLPDEDGTRGITDKVMSVLRVEKMYFDPGGEAFCRITAMASTTDGLALYCPCLKVVGRPDNFTLSFSINSYTKANLNSNPLGVPGSDYQDLLWFLWATKATFWNKGKWQTSNTQLTPDSIDLTVPSITFIEDVSALTLTDGVITYANWANASLSNTQRLFTFIAGLTSPTADPFKWH